MIFGWLKRRRRRRWLEEPFRPEWERAIRQNVAHYRLLSEDEQHRLNRLVQVFVREKHWEGCDGLELTEPMQATIAAQACLLLLEIEHDYYRMLRTILVYPSGYFVRGRVPGGAEVVEGDLPVLGQAHFRGPVILSWQHVLDGGRRPFEGRNLVYHEFAHKLDMKDGLVDGTPVIRDRGQFQRYVEVMSREFDRLRAGRSSGLLREYGATNPGEFFAVATEVFFERPISLRRLHPDVYEVLRDFYRQETAARLERAGYGRA